MNGSLPAAAQVDLRRQPVDDVLERVEQALHVRLDRQALLRKRRSLGGRTERGTWVRIERRGFERIGAQGWNGTEAAAVLQGVAMPEWFQGVAWREQGEPVMWRADELELMTSPSVGKSALVLDDPGLPDTWWEALNASLDALAAQRTPRIATPDTVTITQEQVTQTLGEAFPGLSDTRIERWAPAHADLTWANVMGPEFSVIDWEDWGMAPRGLDAATLWGNALAVPALAGRVRHERRADFESRDGKLMSLFFLSKTLGSLSYEGDPLLAPARKEAKRLVDELQSTPDK
ncbi:aminoglycoside phosphotransferase family protein [Streptomyces sp. NBC_00162]|uniref:aminoglycoside phosphotransferase family protein n=1 Tax=Streptomyces sp. NBC_00162 TaxID=2903629 RepID=UPI00214B0F90|nr:aminoglycoside phosphotransferase family protein [Streptomyces sp. NBC_00162]UUU38737.1 aminoglycoside phosphotransferase family protein [Streptomyces sp. NBC_00162]